MADSALGGKTGVDVPGGKNLVGAFHQPAAVYADTALLATLPEAEWANGFAEIVKTAAVADARLFAWLEASVADLIRRRPAAVEHALAACLRSKGRIVAADERESGRRAALNFGHTVAHALEAASRYEIAHGRAVAIGLRAEGALALRLTRFPARHLARLEALLLALVGAPLHARVSRSAFLAAARRDKKNRAGQVRCALPARIGRMPAGANPTVAVDPALLYECVAS
jgi:3-dehydroquinate synthase